jgi:response regulator NasT
MDYFFSRDLLSPGRTGTNLVGYAENRMKKALRILVADDEPDMREYFQKILPRLGHLVLAAAKDGRELADLCHDLRPDLVITDVRMPELSGLEAVQFIVREQKIPVILISAQGSLAFPESAESEQVMCCLGKPVRQNDLAAAIARAMNRFEELSFPRQAEGFSADLNGNHPE